MRKDLQDFYSFLSEELKCKAKNYYIIEEIDNKSRIKKVSIKQKENFFVLKQKDQFKAGLFKNAIQSCDFIVVSCDKVYFVELKSAPGDTEYDNDENRPIYEVVPSRNNTVGSYKIINGDNSLEVFINTQQSKKTLVKTKNS